MSDTLGQIRSELTKLPVGAGVDLSVLNGFINGRIERLCRTDEWTHLKQDGTIINTTPSYSTGTISINQGATSGTGVGTAFTSGMTGRRIRIANTIEYYFFTFVDANDFTIDRPYAGSTDASGVSFTIFQPLVTLPANLSEALAVGNPQIGRQLDKKDRDYLDQNYQSRIAYGPAEIWAPAQDLNGLTVIEVYPGPDLGEGLTLRWKLAPPKLVSSSDLLPDWISTAAIKAGVRADLYRLADDQSRALAEETEWRSLVAINRQEDVRRTPPAETHIDERYTYHRIRRVLRNSDNATNRNWRSAN